MAKIFDEIPQEIRKHAQDCLAKMAAQRATEHHEAERELHATHGDHNQRELEDDLSKLRLAEQIQAFRDALRIWVPIFAANAGHLLNQLLGVLIAEMPVPKDMKHWDVSELERVREALFKETVSEMVREVTVTARPRH